MKIIVVSGINLFRGGTLKVMQECIAEISSYIGDDSKIIALVYDENQHPQYDNVEYISFPKSRKSYFHRLYYEYIGFNKLSKEIKPYCWFSMHDSTPNVSATKKFVYCHNPFPFYKKKLRDLFLQPNIFLLTLLSYYIYKINIKKNNYVIVQQEWLRAKFKEFYSIDNVIVSLPSKSNDLNEYADKIAKPHDKISFLYPSTSIVHKNIETLCEAARILEQKGRTDFEVCITLVPLENGYSKYVYNKYKDLKTVHFVGYLTREQMHNRYLLSDCLAFPSYVETWGLPLSEAKEYKLPILVSDLPYAKETVGKYDKVKFFDPDNADQLAGYMEDFIEGTLSYDKTTEISYSPPFAKNWQELISLILPELKR